MLFPSSRDLHFLRNEKVERLLSPLIASPFYFLCFFGSQIPLQLHRAPRMPHIQIIFLLVRSIQVLKRFPRVRSSHPSQFCLLVLIPYLVLFFFGLNSTMCCIFDMASSPFRSRTTQGTEHYLVDMSHHS